MGSAVLGSPIVLVQVALKVASRHAASLAIDDGAFMRAPGLGLGGLGPRFEHPRTFPFLPFDEADDACDGGGDSTYRAENGEGVHNSLF